MNEVETLPEVYETPQQITEIFPSDPVKALEVMGSLVEAVAKKCVGDRFIADIQGKQYPKVEWWTTVGASLGLFPVTEYSRRLDRPDEIAYEARVSVRRHGEVVTAAESICSTAEKRWDHADEYAIKSMAATRATGKAYRLGLSMLAVMANLEPTPAEEIPPGGFGQTQYVDTPFSRDTKVGGKGIHKDLAWKDVPKDYLGWAVSTDKDTKFKRFAQAELEARKEAPQNVPELSLFMKALPETSRYALLFDRYAVGTVDEMDPTQQEDLLAWFQAEADARVVYGRNKEEADTLIKSRFGTSYVMLSPDQMTELAELLKDAK